MKIPLFFIACISLALLMHGIAGAQNITASTSGWNLSVDATRLSTGAGSDLLPTYTSVNNATVLHVSGYSAAQLWHVDVNKIDTGSWPFTLSVSKYSDGSGPGAITTVQNPVTLSSAAVTFFRGRANRNGLSFGYTLGGMSLAIPPGTYSTTVVYTLVNN